MRSVTQDPLKKEIRLLRQLSGSPTPDQIHGFRTTARRIEALLAEVFDRLGKNERKLLKQLARVRRRAGRVRDLDVQMKTLEELHLGREAECKLQVLQHLRNRRKKALRRLVDAVDDDTALRLRKRLVKTTQKVTKAAGANSGNSRAGGRNSSSALTLVGRRLKKLQTKLPLSEETLHEYRLRCKRLRYTLELSTDPQAPHIIEQFKTIQDAVGRWHDSTVLLETAQSVIDHPGTCPLISALRNLSKAQLWQGLQVTRNVVTDLAGDSGRKPIRAKAPPTMVTAASA